MNDPQIPSGWQKKSLGKIASIKIGKTPPRDREEFWDSHKRTRNVWLSIKDMTSRFLFDSAEYITDKAIREINIPVVEKGTILLSFKLTIGKVAIAQRELRTNEAIAAIRILDSNQTDNDFVSYGLSHWNLLQDVDQAIKGTTLNKKKLREIEFILPINPAEQRKIAEILTAVDDAIEQTEALIRKYQRVKQGLMQDLLTRGVDENGSLRPPPELAPHLYIETPQGWLPEGWEIKTVDDLSVYVGSGITPRGGSEVYGTEGILFVRSQNVTFEGLLLNDIAFISESMHNSMRRSEIFPNDVLLNITGASIGRCCVFPEGLGKANVNQHVCAIRLCKPTIYNAHYLSLVLSSWIGQSQIDKLNAGGNRQGLNYEQLRSFKIPWPEESERRKISEIYKANAELVSEERKNLAKLQAIRRGLMQDLLTGKVRVV